MSSIIGSDTSIISNTSNDRYFAVDREQPEGLADYVRRVRFEKGFSLLAVQRNSRGQIAGSYVSRIENGIADAEGVTPKKLQALAVGLQVPEDEIFAVARGQSMSGDLTLEETRLLHCFRSIPLERKTDALGYLEMLFKLYGKNGDDTSKVGKGGPQAGKVYDAVAGIPNAVKRGAGKTSKKRR
jgi:transcriptional regulator with XRE-family HTH domain